MEVLGLGERPAQQLRAHRLSVSHDQAAVGLGGKHRLDEHGFARALAGLTAVEIDAGRYSGLSVSDDRAYS